MKEMGLDWAIYAHAVTGNEGERSSFISCQLANKSDKATCYIHMSRGLHPSEKNSNISFLYNNQTDIEHSRFMDKEWPLFWALTGRLFQAADTVRKLGDEAMEYFNNYNSSQHGHISWYGRSGDIYCNVIFRWHELLERFVPDGIYLNDCDTLEDMLDNTAKSYPINYSSIIALEDVSKASAYITDPDTDKMIVATEQITDIAPPAEGLDISDANITVPTNADRYRQGILTDESGSMPVYITPGHRTDEELGEEIRHYIVIRSMPEPCALILSSVKNTTYGCN